MKRMIALGLFAILVIVVGILGYVRLAPTDPVRWHVPVIADADKDMPGGAIRVVRVGPDALALVDEAARGFERTQVLAGSVEQGRVTYVSRSKLIGFPDYTTVEQDGDVLKIHARLRFGRSDLGVNRARVLKLLAALP
jgi:hypothetical protein